MTLTEKYLQSVRKHKMVEDPAQIQTIKQLQHLNDALSHPGRLQRWRQRYPVLLEICLAKLCSVFRLFHTGCPGQVERGLYLWGDVGRGKTWLMDLFFENLPFAEKRRLHFHAFMQSVHLQLGQMKKQKNPLRIVARHFARDARILCLDEFIVTNIADAMLLSGLLSALFDYCVTLVATSNRIPDNLYLHGLQRERFLPAIALIKKHTRVTHLDNGVDHRLALLEHARLYLYPCNDDNNRLLETRFSELTAGKYQSKISITLLGRTVQTIAAADDIIWFDFTIICSSPRAAQDYVEIASLYHTVFISNVPQMDSASDDKARRFIYLIDALYDSRVKLLTSAQLAPEKLYTGTMLEFAFHRTSSRLIEMRTASYLAQAHCPQQIN